MRKGPRSVLVDAPCARCGRPTQRYAVRDWVPVEPDPEKVCATCSSDLIWERRLAAMTAEDEAAELADLQWYEADHVAGGSRSYAHEKTTRALVARDQLALVERRGRYHYAEEREPS